MIALSRGDQPGWPSWCAAIRGQAYEVSALTAITAEPRELRRGESMSDRLVRFPERLGDVLCPMDLEVE